MKRGCDYCDSFVNFLCIFINGTYIVLFSSFCRYRTLRSFMVLFCLSPYDSSLRLLLIQ